jgi:2-aminobenzoate-CoA ligase
MSHYLPPNTVQTDRFIHDRLPARAAWPRLSYDAPEFQIADQANVVSSLLDAQIARGHAARAGSRSWMKRSV